VPVNPQGQILWAWEEGREIRWQEISSQGAVIDSGDAGPLPDGSKATGYVDPQGEFCLVF